MDKKPLTGLFRDNPSTPEGKYLVKRRDGSVPPWPSFVLAGPDPIAADALLEYCKQVCFLLICQPEEAAKLGFTPEYACRVHQWVQAYHDYRFQHGASDPGMGPHRQDDLTTVEEMKKGMSA